MKLARVVGTVVSTINVPVFDDRKLLVCDLLAPDGAPAGGYLIAVDTVGAGPGETVLLMDEGGSARQILGSADGPVRTVVVGIVDAVELAPGPLGMAARLGRPDAAPGRRTRAASPGPTRRARRGSTA